MRVENLGLKTKVTLILPAFSPEPDKERYPYAHQVITAGQFIQTLPVSPCHHACLYFFNPLIAESFSWAALSAWDEQIVENNSSAWLLTEPVHIVLDQHRAYLKEKISLDANEYGRLSDDLIPFFKAEGYDLSPTHQGYWLLKVKAGTTIISRPLPQMYGQSLARTLPSGEEGLEWRQLFTSAQLFLYHHPVNQHRRLKGEPTVDGLWFWGEGTLSEPVQTGLTHVFTDLYPVKVLSRYYGVPSYPLTELNAYLNEAGQYLIVLPEESTLESVEDILNALQSFLKQSETCTIQYVVNQKLYQMKAVKKNTWWDRLQKISAFLRTRVNIS